MNQSLKKYIGIGVIIEILIVVYAYMVTPDIADMFRLSARYSGRLSAAIFIGSFYLFSKAYPNSVVKDSNWNNSIVVFAILHFIHFGFLATSVYLNDSPLETVKVIGGALAYAMIVGAPFVWEKLKASHLLIYYYYVSIVMIMTYVARLKGDFVGAEPFWLHYVMLVILASCAVFFGYRIYSKKNTN